MTARGVGDVDVAELVGVGADGVAQRALVELHVVNVVEHLEHGRADQAGHLGGHLGVGEEVADVVGGDVERLEVHRDAAFLGDLGAFEQHIVHRAQLDGVRKLVIVVDDDAAVAQRVRVDGDALRADLLRGRDRLAQEIEVLFLVGGVDQGVVGVAVEAGNADAGLFSRGLDRVQILVGPAPELDELKAVVLGGLEAVQEGNFGIHRLDAGGTHEFHNQLPPIWDGGEALGLCTCTVCAFYGLIIGGRCVLCQSCLHTSRTAPAF